LTGAEIEQVITGMQGTANRHSGVRPALSSLDYLRSTNSPNGDTKVSEKGRPNSPEEGGLETREIPRP
jgi:hypothetical protein